MRTEHVAKTRPAPTVRLRRLAAELRQLRKVADLTREEVTQRTGINAATLYRIETARVRSQARTLAALLDVYGVDEPRRTELMVLLKEAGQRGWLHTFSSELPEHYTTYIEFEAEASAVWNYESLFIPGLLQTEEYARAVIRGTLPQATRDEIERRVEARVLRQSVLNKENPLKLWSIVDEAAVRRAVGGPQVMAAQLRHLLDVLEMPHVTIQVIRFDAGAHPGMPGSFVVMQFPELVGPNVVYLDSMAGDLFLEEETDVSRYTLLFDHLRAVALSPDASASLITSAAKGA